MLTRCLEYSFLLHFFPFLFLFLLPSKLSFQLFTTKNKRPLPLKKLEQAFSPLTEFPSTISPIVYLPNETTDLSSISTPFSFLQLLSCLSKPLQFPLPNFSQFYYQFRLKPLKFAFARSSANSPGTFELIVDANTDRERDTVTERIKERERERENEARFAAVAGCVEAGPIKF